MTPNVGSGIWSKPHVGHTDARRFIGAPQFGHGRRRRTTNTHMIADRGNTPRSHAQPTHDVGSSSIQTPKPMLTSATTQKTGAAPRRRNHLVLTPSADLLGVLRRHRPVRQ